LGLCNFEAFSVRDKDFVLKTMPQPQQPDHRRTKMKASISGRAICLAVICLSIVSIATADGIVPAGTSQLADDGPSQWTLSGNYTSPTGTNFIIGGFDRPKNYLTIASGQTFTVSSGLLIGTEYSERNLLEVQPAAEVVVNGNLQLGYGTIYYFSDENRIEVTGPGALVSVTGNLDMDNFRTANDCVLSIRDGGTVIVDSDKDGTGSFSIYNHWCYGNSWLELDDGMLAIWGDQTSLFSDQGIQSSIKVWDDSTESFQRIAYYDVTTWTPTEYIDCLNVDYVQDSAHASSLGISSDFVGFTVVTAVPEPTTISLLLFGSLTIAGLATRRRNRRA
jgi:PEP-CTERM motif